MVRFDSLGVTSFIRALSLDHRFYESMLHFFRSNAFTTEKLKLCWHKLVFHHAQKLCQESEDSSKPQFIHGHMFGGIGAVIGNESNTFCIPLNLNIQDGLKETASWDNGNLSSSASHVIQMIRNAHDISQTFAEDSYCVLDRYFLTVPALAELSTLNDGSAHRLDIITRAKNNCIAYEEPAQNPAPHRGVNVKRGLLSNWDSFLLTGLINSKKQLS